MSNSFQIGSIRGQILSMDGIDLAALDKRILDQNTGRVALRSATEWATSFTPNELRIWCVKRARYCIPTLELIEWLKTRIGDRIAVEIGAGMGDLGFHLGIPMSDSYQQVEDKLTVTQMTAMGQEPTRPPNDVRREDAENVVRRCKPQVVVGAWITQKWDGGGDGNYLGPREDYILERCNTYIMIGNKKIHSGKRILKLPHEELEFPWLISRAADPSLNRIWIWEQKK